MHITAGHPRDFARLQEIERAAGGCFRDIGMAEIAADEPPSRQILHAYARAGGLWALAPAEDAAPLAYALTAPVDGCLHVEQLSVHPDGARRGLGRALLDHLSSRATAEGVPALTLTTFTDVPWNAPYYARLGFRTLTSGELTPQLRDIRRREAAAGLDRWPRVCMRRPCGSVPPRP